MSGADLVAMVDLEGVSAEDLRRSAEDLDALAASDLVMTRQTRRDLRRAAPAIRDAVDLDAAPGRV